MKKGLFVLTLSLLLNLSCFAESEMQRTNAMMIDCIQNRLCSEANAQRQEVYVDEYVWRTSNFRDKENIARFFMAYTRVRNSYARFVDIKSSTSGRKIASYNEYSGYKE